MYSGKEIKEWLRKSEQWLQSGTDIAELRNVLRFHEHRYYTMNDPLITDEHYDKLYKILVQKEKEAPESITPDSPTQRVGADLNKEFETVRHLVPMLSLENSYNTGDVVDWQRRLQSTIGREGLQYSVEPKFDGAGISLVYENDLLTRGATRGDGTEGDDITTNIKQIGSVPLSANFSRYGVRKIEIRGEVLLTKENFGRYNERLAEDGLPPLANPRNAAAGSLRMKDPADVRKRKLEAVLYHVSYIEFEQQHDPAFNTHSGSLQLLAALGFKTPVPDQEVFDDIQKVLNYCLQFEDKRDALPYEIDGMVIKLNDIEMQQQSGSTSHHPRWAMAFKFKARQATSILEHVEYQVGRTGSITPVAKIKPVHIGGVTVTSVSLFNQSIIEEKDLRIGDTVIVERAGDVIPYIVKSQEELRTGNEQPIIFPTKCPVCDDPLSKPDGEAVWRCNNINCEAQVVERMIHFVSKNAMDIKSLGSSNVKKFYALGIIKDIPSIYEINFEKISRLEGFGEKSATKLKHAIEASKRQELHRLIFGLGIRYVGEATARELAKNVENIFELEKLSVAQFQQMKDIGSKVSETLFAFFQNKDNMDMLSKLERQGLNMKSTARKTAEGPLAGKTFLFTGTLPTLKRSAAEKMAEDQGGRLLSSVSANLNYLVAGEAAGSKLDKAKKNKTIQIINEEEFLNLMAR